jgi:quercetin dioxygenase-like cupin family protein
MTAASRGRADGAIGSSHHLHLEDGATSPLELLALARMLDSSPKGAVMTTATGETTTRLLHRGAGTGPSYWGPGDRYTFLVTGAQSGGAYFIMEAVVPPGGGPPPHVHHADDELFIILEGRYSILAQGQWTEVGPGAVVYLPRGSVHTFRNIGDGPARHCVLTTPSGFERFYARCAEVFTQPGPPDRERLVEISREHGYEFA